MQKIKLLVVWLLSLCLVTSAFAAEMTCADYIRRSAHKNHFLHLIPGLGTVVFISGMLGPYLFNLADAKILDAASLLVSEKGTFKEQKKAKKRVYNFYFSKDRFLQISSLVEVTQKLNRINLQGGNAYCERIFQAAYGNRGLGLRDVFFEFE